MNPPYEYAIVELTTGEGELDPEREVRLVRRQLEPPSEMFVGNWRDEAVMPNKVALRIIEMRERFAGALTDLQRVTANRLELGTENENLAAANTRLRQALEARPSTRPIGWARSRRARERHPGVFVPLDHLAERFTPPDLEGDWTLVYAVVTGEPVVDEALTPYPRQP